MFEKKEVEKKDEFKPAKIYLVICGLVIAALLIPWFLYLSGVITKTAMACIVLPLGAAVICAAIIIKKRHRDRSGSF